MKNFLLCFFLSLPMAAIAQQLSEREQVISVIQMLFDGMRAADTTMVRAAFHPQAQLQSTSVNAEGRPQFTTTEINRFIASIAARKGAVLDERIHSYDVRIDQGLAAVWTDYTFFVGSDFSHCGVNAFHLFKGEEGWKIVQITDTRRKADCVQEPQSAESELEQLIDGWHHAAAVADEDTFFGLMAPYGIYIGTDASERWLRDELKAWAKSAFDRESAWAFTSKDRTIRVSDDNRHAWWDELLDTWMGVCRGSGVLENTAGGWKITHYQLSLTVPNDKIERFKKMVAK
ncbi:MAG: nuclear transport factor 2 family protein [Saprospiraceae bacterium]